MVLEKSLEALRGFIEVEKAKLEQALADAVKFEEELDDIERDLYGVSHNERSSKICAFYFSSNKDILQIRFHYPSVLIPPGVGAVGGAQGYRQ